MSGPTTPELPDRLGEEAGIDARWESARAAGSFSFRRRIRWVELASLTGLNRA